MENFSWMSYAIVTAASVLIAARTCRQCRKDGYLVNEIVGFSMLFGGVFAMIGYTVIYLALHVFAAM